MKSVLISIQPKWCEKISKVIFYTGDEKPVYEKSVEIRKTRPKIQTPFKVYVYETQEKKFKDIGVHWESGQTFEHHIGKVIGEFVCDSIRKISYNRKDKGVWLKSIVGDFVLENAALSQEELASYLKNGSGYAWSISNLVIYDKPRELSEFCTVDNEAVKQCEHRERVYNNPDYTNGAWLPGSYVCNKDETDWCTKCKTKPITRPPQSWCYVEEIS